MKVLIIIPRYNLTNKKNFLYNFPLGLAYISSTLKKAKYEVDCLNMNHLDGDSEYILRNFLYKKEYNVICTGGNSLIYTTLENIIKSVRKYSSKSYIVIGGPIITSEPELMTQSLIPDFAVIGEGEETILDLLDCIKNNKDIKKVRGIIYLDKEGKLIITEKRGFIEDIDSISYPDFEGFGFDKHVENNVSNYTYIYNCLDNPRTYPLLASRGCPFNCSFCWHSEKNRKRSIKNIMKEIGFAVKHYKINNIILYDDCFSATKDRVYEFCKELKKLSKKLNCELKWTCQLMVFSVDYDILKTMKDAGCSSISYGFESFSPIILRSMRKPITPEQINKTFKETLKAGIGVQANFILGDIAETKETAKITIDYWKKTYGQIGLGFVQPYPGSDIYRYCIQKGIIKDKLHYIKYEMGPHSCIKMTEHMTVEEFNDIKKEVFDAFAKYVHFINPINLKKINYQKKIYETVVRCPFCKQKITYKNCFIYNKFSFGFNLICRNCHYRFFVVSLLQKLAYKNYSIIRPLRDYYLKIIDNLKQRKL